MLLLCLYSGSCTGAPSDTSAPNVDRSLFLAICQNNIAQAKAALDAGANPNRKIKSSTLLMGAAINHEPDTMRLLMDKGADVNAKDQYGRMAVDFLATDTRLSLFSKC